MGEIGIRSGGKDMVMEHVGAWNCVLLLLRRSLQLQLARCATNVNKQLQQLNTMGLAVTC